MSETEKGFGTGLRAQLERKKTDGETASTELTLNEPMHKAPESRGSVQRTGVGGEFVPHRELPAPYAGLPWSPGRFEVKK